MTIQYQGVWTLAQQAQLQSTQQWVTDPNFKDVTLLLQADDAANGAQNNTFLDSSPNSFSVTRSGNPLQGSFTPFSPGWGICLDGSSLINRPAGLETAFAGWGGRTRTWECWVYRSSAADYTMQSAYTATSQSDRWYISITSNKLRFAWTLTTSTETFVSTVAAIPTGWVYLSVTIDATTASSATIYLGINGRVETFTNNNLSTQTTTDPWQALFGAAYAQQNLTGYFTGLRWSDNLRYTSNYAVPTAPLVNDGNTLFLFGQGNRFRDQSSNGYAITVNTGTPSVQPFSPFTGQYQYTSSVIGGSGYLDGTGDYLTVNGGTSLSFGSGDFSLEMFVYPTTSGTVRKIYDARPSTTAGNFPILEINASNVTVFYIDTTSVITGTTVVPANSWTHILVSRVSGNLRLFVNGAQDGSTVSNSTNFGNGNARPAIGTRGSTLSGDVYTGYISSVRALIGSGFTSVTVPTSPPSPTDSALYLDFSNASIYDGSMKNVLETVNQAQVSTALVKYGTGSMYFDGTTDYLVVRTPVSGSFIFGTGPFTVEAWVYPLSLSTGPVIIDSNTGGDATGTGRFLFDITSAGVLSLRTGTGSVLTSGGVIVTNAWQHVAVTRDENSIARLFINGVLVNTPAVVTTNFNMKVADRPFVGANAYSASSQNFNGYMDDVRVTNNVARYLATFTPPPVALPRQ